MSILGSAKSNNAVDEINQPYKTMKSNCNSLYLYRTKSVSDIGKSCDLINSITNRSHDLENKMQSINRHMNNFKSKEAYAEEYSNKKNTGFANKTMNPVELAGIITTLGTSITEKIPGLIYDPEFKMPSEQATPRIKPMHEKLISALVRDKSNKQYIEDLERHKYSIDECSNRICELIDRTQKAYDDLKNDYEQASKFVGTDFSELSGYDQSFIHNLANVALELSKLINEEVS